MNKILIVSLILGLFVIGSVNAYICIDRQNDNISVQEFKYKMNLISLKTDLDNGLTQDAIRLKLKYFNPCN